MNRYRATFRTLILGLLGAGLIACAPSNGGTSDEQSYGTVTMPLTAESPTDGAFFVEEATFSLTGPQDALITVSGDGTSRFERTIRTGTYTLHVLGSVRMQRISPEGEVEYFIAELDGPSPVFEVRKSEITAVTVRLVSRRFTVELAESSVGEVSIGAVVTFDETAADCAAGQAEEAHCGFNLSGVTERSCQDGQWGPWSPCSDHHDCELGSVEFIHCVLPNGERGELQLFCDVFGQFSIPGECMSPDAREPVTPETPEQTSAQGCQDAWFEVACLDGTGHTFVACDAENDAWMVEMENSAGCASASNPMLIIASDQAHIHELGDCELAGLMMGEVSPVECDSTEEGLSMFAFQFCHDGWAYETGCAEANEEDINKMLGAAPRSPDATQPEHMPSDIPLGCQPGGHFGLTCLNDAGLSINAWVFCDGFDDEKKWFIESEEGTCAHFEDSRITYVNMEEIFESGSCDEFGMAPGDVRFSECENPHGHHGEVSVTYCDAHQQVFMSRCAPLGDLEELTIDHCEGDVAIAYAPCEQHMGVLSVPGIGVQTCRNSEWRESCLIPNDTESDLSESSKTSDKGLIIEEEELTTWKKFLIWWNGWLVCSGTYVNTHPAGTGYTKGERVTITFAHRATTPRTILSGLLGENPDPADGTRSQWLLNPVSSATCMTVAF